MQIFRKQKCADMEISINTDLIITNTIVHKLRNILHIFVNNNKQVTNKMVKNSCFNLFFLILCEPPVYPCPGFIPKHYSKTEEKNYLDFVTWLNEKQSSLTLNGASASKSDHFKSMY